MGVARGAQVRPRPGENGGFYVGAVLLTQYWQAVSAVAQGRSRGMGDRRRRMGGPGGMGGRGGGDLGGEVPQMRRQSKHDMLLDSSSSIGTEGRGHKISAAAMRKRSAGEQLLKGRMAIANSITGKASEDDPQEALGACTPLSTRR